MPHAATAKESSMTKPNVIPAQAGIQPITGSAFWTLAFAGVTITIDPRQ